MRKMLVFVSVAVLVLSVCATDLQAQRASAAQAKLWVEKGEAYIKEHGIKQALLEFNNPKGQFVKGELYINAFRLDGKILAFPMDKSKVGLQRLEFKDIDGKPVMKEFVNLVKTKGSGWIDYKYVNRQTNQIVQKTGYAKKVTDDVFLMCSASK